MQTAVHQHQIELTEHGQGYGRDLIACSVCSLRVQAESVCSTESEHKTDSRHPKSRNQISEAPRGERKQHLRVRLILELNALSNHTSRVKLIL